MTQQDAITLYEAISAITGGMLAAARAADWELLAVLESRCAAHVRVLQAQEPREPKEPLQALRSPAREQKIKLIQRILADESEILTLTKAGMAQLSILMNCASTERKLSNAYGA